MVKDTIIYSCHIKTYIVIDSSSLMSQRVFLNLEIGYMSMYIVRMILIMLKISIFLVTGLIELRLLVIYSILLKLIIHLINSMLCKLYSVLLHTLIWMNTKQLGGIEAENHGAVKQWIKDFSKKFLDREETIEEKSKYILNNWAAL